MKLLSIIIPYHTETIKEITPLFRTINEQVGIKFEDVEIILCKDTDLENEIDTYDFAEYENLTGRIIKLVADQKNNPGMSRQYALDHCNGEYAFFCDADDALYSLSVLRSLFNEINATHADIYRFKFMEEVGSFFSDELQYLEHNFNWIWVFAKAYRVEFLKDHLIRFNPKLRWHEDSYFNLLCQYCKPKAYDVPIYAYLWRFNKKSITRVNNHEYTFNSIPDYLLAAAEAFEKGVSQYNVDCTKDILAVINRYYMTLNDPNNFNQKMYEQVEQCYFNFVRRIAVSLFSDISPELQKIIANLPKGEGQDFLPAYTLPGYLKYLADKYGLNQTLTEAKPQE